MHHGCRIQACHSWSVRAIAFTRRCTIRLVSTAAISLLSLSLLAGLTACHPTTEFRGEAHFPGGAPACAAKCRQGGLEMSGFVYSGEFASSCVCRPPHAPSAAPGAPATPAAPTSSTDREEDDSAAPDVAAAVATVTAMRAEEERRRQAASGWRGHQQQQQSTPSFPHR